MQQIGDTVTYVDSLRQERPALVTNVGAPDEAPWLNLVVVSDDPARDDSYGRQIERFTSVVHQSRQTAPGNYWK